MEEIIVNWKTGQKKIFRQKQREKKSMENTVKGLRDICNVVERYNTFVKWSTSRTEQARAIFEEIIKGFFKINQR